MKKRPQRAMSAPNVPGCVPEESSSEDATARMFHTRRTKSLKAGCPRAADIPALSLTGGQPEKVEFSGGLKSYYRFNRG